MYCNCTTIPRHRWLSALYSIGTSHFHGLASDLFLPDTASTLIHCFKNISSHCLPSSHFLLGSPGFLLPFWRTVVVNYWAYRGAGGKVILLDFKIYPNSCLSQWPKHTIWGRWWTAFTILKLTLHVLSLPLLHPTLIGQYSETSAC